LIKVIVKIRENRIVECTIKGHGGGTEGNDIVCAAVSAVSQTALSGLLHYVEEGIFWEKKKGYLKIKNKTQEWEKQKSASIILNTLLLGLKNIACEFPQRVNIKIL